MKHRHTLSWLCLLLTMALGNVRAEAAATLNADDFGAWFQDATLRADYIFSGTAREQHIALDELRCAKGWFGRRNNMDTLVLIGNGIITMTDAESGRTLYKTSFSTLFQEWQTTEEASRLTKAFENVFQLPMPRRDAVVNVTLYDTHNRATASFSHRVKTDDILIRPLATAHPAPHRSLHRGGDSKECIDVVIVGEGYTAEEAETFYADAQRACDEILRYQPFAANRKHLNMTAVLPESRESGVSIPGKNVWKETALSASFDTFYSARYLTTLRLKTLNDALAGIPYEHIIILANTDNYGGGGIYNSYTLSAAHNEKFLPVTVHEFGHSFGGLADEYFYDDQYEEFYFAGIEPWEKNITTLTDFNSKWADMLPAGTAIPTPTEGTAPTDMEHIGVYEGGGYMSKGVYRAFRDCRMKTNEVEAFCKVCERALQEVIDFHVVPLH